MCPICQASNDELLPNVAPESENKSDNVIEKESTLEEKDR